MSSSDRSDGSDSGRKTPTGAGAPSEAGKPEPIERSPRGRIVIRSSSHPPTGEHGDPRDVSGARALPASDRAPAIGDDRDEGAEARSKRSTPAERPRRRRKVQAERAAQGMTPGFAGSRRRTPDRLASAGAGQGVTEAKATASETRGAARARTIAIGVAVAVAIAIVGAALWLLHR
jgi:hypothetical protein